VALRTRAHASTLAAQPIAIFSMNSKTLGYKPLVTMSFLLTMVINACTGASLKNKWDSGVAIGDKTQRFYCITEHIKLHVQHMMKVGVFTLQSQLSYLLIAQKSSCTTNTRLQQYF